MIAKLQFISNGKTPSEHLDNIAAALEAGCHWIQLRMKNTDEVVVAQTALSARKLTQTYGAKLIINDYPHIAREVAADGVHLGLTDMPIREARTIVGPELILGGTANTFEHVVQRIAEGVDYVGLGPFRFTSTKEKLSPILGVEGYQSVTKRLHDLGLSVPIIAIGGITETDLPSLLATGVHGVALSGTIITAVDQKMTVSQIHEQLC